MQQLADYAEQIRALMWSIADYVASTVETLMASGVGKREACNLVGGKMGHSHRWAELQHAISTTFPEDYRFPMLDLIVYREALRADDPLSAIIMAADELMSAKEMRAWIDGGRPVTRTAISLEGMMTWTGHDMVIVPEVLSGLTLGEGLKDVPVKATIRTQERKRLASADGVPDPDGVPPR